MEKNDGEESVNNYYVVPSVLKKYLYYRQKFEWRFFKIKIFLL